MKDSRKHDSKRDDEGGATKSPQKFLFNMNNFNEDYEEEPEEEAPPPPPTFSEQELEQAQKKGYDQGRKDALAEAEAARETTVTALLETISQSMTSLFENETARASLFEQEAVHLSHSIFKKLFPALNDQNGLAEVSQVLTRILENQTDKPEIIIEVPDDYVEDIRRHADTLQSKLHSTGTCTIEAGADLTCGSCRLRWKNGGALRDSAALARQIEDELQRVLADTPGLRDNEDNDTDKAQTEIEE